MVICTFPWTIPPGKSPSRHSLQFVPSERHSLCMCCFFFNLSIVIYRYQNCAFSHGVDWVTNSKLVYVYTHRWTARRGAVGGACRWRHQLTGSGQTVQCGQCYEWCWMWLCYSGWHSSSSLCPSCSVTSVSCTVCMVTLTSVLSPSLWICNVFSFVVFQSPCAQPWLSISTTPHRQNVCLRRYRIHTFVHSWWRPLVSANTNYNSAVCRRLYSELELWPVHTNLYQFRISSLSRLLRRQWQTDWLSETHARLKEYLSISHVLTRR